MKNRGSTLTNDSECVVIDQIMGTVEKISVRSFQLRHHNGPVHTISYGEIRSVTNWSRDRAIMKIDLGNSLTGNMVKAVTK